MKIRELPVYERPREKMVRFGRSSLSNGELLAILLRTGTKEKTALRLADDILSLDPNGLLYLQECSLEELAGVKGIGLAKACQIGAAVELGKRIATMPREERNIIKSTQDVADVFMEKMRYYKKEHFDVLLLDAKGNLIAVENVAIGDIASSIVHPRETFQSAIKRGAFAVILIHNHPSGDPTPSKEDIHVTERLSQAGEILGINVLDHIIIGDGTYISLKGAGFI